MLATVAGAAGCRLLVPTDQRPAPPDPDVVVTMRALAAEQALIDAYALFAERHGSLANRLAAFRRRHTAHREALHARLPVDASGRVVTPTPAAPATPSASASPETSSSPRTGDSLASLVAAEHAAAEDRLADALHASPTLAEVLASIGACEAAHVELLAGLDG
ncbi:MAG: hypothetical protein J2P24_18465 [Streptosporangiales bacterium]|nr:hypothetical protein [Streptosporangiales bacterium]